MTKKSKSQKKYETKKLPKDLQRRKDFKNKTKNWKKKNYEDEQEELDQKLAEQQKIADQKNQTKPKEAKEAKDFDKFVQDGYNKLMEDSSDEDDEEEDEEFSDEGKEEEPEEQNLNIGDQIKGHKSQLKDLERNDPKFYEYLMKKDQNLLDFNTDDKYNPEEDRNRVTTNKLQKWIESSNRGSIRALRNIVIAFYLATEFDSGDEKSLKRKEKLKEKNNLVVGDEVTYNLLISFIYEEAPSIIYDFLERTQKTKKAKKEGGGEGEEEEEEEEETVVSDKVKLPASFKKWGEVRTISRMMVNAMLQMVGTVKEEGGLKFILQNLESTGSIFFSVFKRERSKLLKRLLVLWSSEENVEVRLLAFLVIRKMCLTTPFPFLSLALKGVYLTFIQNSSSLSSRTAPYISAMINCIVELYKLDLNLSYQHAFIYIRQLSIHLRNTLLSNPSKKNLQRSIYNWKFVHSLRVWVQLLSQTCPSSSAPPPSALPSNNNNTNNNNNKGNKKKGKQQQKNEEEEDPNAPPVLEEKGGKKNKSTSANNTNMSLLVYPLVQIICGSIEMKSGGTSYIPLHLTLVQYLNNLSINCGVFVPLSTYLLNILDKSIFSSASIEFFKKKAKAEKGKKSVPILSNESLFLTLKLSENYYTNRFNLQLVFENIAHVLLSNLSYWSKNVSFPELSLPVLLSLKKYSKTFKFLPFTKILKSLIKSIEETNSLIESKRNSLQVSPKNITNSFIIPATTSTPCVKYLQSFTQKRSQTKPPPNAIKDFPEEEQEISEEKPKSNKRKNFQDEDDENDSTKKPKIQEDTPFTKNSLKTLLGKLDKKLPKNEKMDEDEDDDKVDDFVLSED